MCGGEVTKRSRCDRPLPRSRRKRPAPDPIRKAQVSDRGVASARGCAEVGSGLALGRRYRVVRASGWAWVSITAPSGTIVPWRMTTSPATAAPARNEAAAPDLAVAE